MGKEGFPLSQRGSEGDFVILLTSSESRIIIGTLPLPLKKERFL
jgi:hypothetical protein